MSLESLKAEIDSLKAQLQEKQQASLPSAPLRSDLEIGQTIAADGTLRLVYQPAFKVPVETNIHGHPGQVSLRSDTPYIIVEESGRVQANCRTEESGRFWLKRLAAR